jgi:hypothetical protein
MVAVIPLIATPSQTLAVLLNQQSCSINVYQKSTGLFVDLTLNGNLLIGGVVCHDRTLIVRDTYLGFVGDLAFIDTQGTDDPSYTNLGTRWVLDYLTPTDIATPSVSVPYWVPRQNFGNNTPPGMPLSVTIT